MARASEFVSSDESPPRRKLRDSKQFEQAIRSLEFKTAVLSKWKWAGDKINKL